MQPTDRFHPVLTVFGVRRRVSRSAYVVTGLVLLLLRYAVEGTLVWGTLGRWMWPLELLSPFFAHRAAILATLPPAAAWAMIALHLPFLWIGLSMSARRAIDAGLKPWWGLFFVVPLFQYVLICVLAVMPSRPATPPSGAGPFRSGALREPEPLPVPPHVDLFRLLRATLLGCAASAALMATAVHWLPNWLHLVPLPMGGFIAGAVAARSGKPAATSTQTRASRLKWGLAFAACFPAFYWLLTSGSPDIGKATLGSFLLIFPLVCSVFGLYQSAWSLGAYAGAAGDTLDRNDLSTQPEPPAGAGGEPGVES